MVGRIGQQRRARAARDREPSQLARLDVRRRGAHLVEHHRDVSRDHVDDRLRVALVRHVQHLHARLAIEKLGRHVTRAAGARRCVGNLVRPRLGERDQLLDGAHRQRRVDDEHLRHQARERDRREILERIVAGVGNERRHDRERVGDREQRVAVGRRFRDELRADEAARARPIVDDHLLTEPFAEPRRERADDEVDVAAGRERHDDADRRARGMRLLSGRGPPPPEPGPELRQPISSLASWRVPV